MINFIKKNKKLIGLLLIIGAGFMLAPSALAASGDAIMWDVVKNGAVTAVGWIVYGWVWIIGQLSVLLIAVIIDLAKYNDFVTSSAVENGWVIIRDVVNMFFILILLVISFATIFNVKEYKYQAMLPRLLIMAVVINFSRTIAGVLIDFGQVVMLTFVNGFQAAAGGNFIKALKIEELLKFQDQPGNTDLLKVFASFVLAAIMITVTAVVLGAFAIMLVMRIVTLWFLVVLSPIAFLASVWPSGRIQQKYALWWDMFLDNIMVGPILAFFLWLSLLVLGSGDVATTDAVVKSTYEQESGISGGLSAGYTKIGTLDNMISYLMGIGMLLGSLYMAQSMRAAGAGIAGAALGKVKGYASSAVRKPISGAWRATKFGVRKSVGGAYEVTGARSRVDLTVSKFRDTGFARALGMGKKEDVDRQKLKRDEAAYRRFGDIGKADAIRRKMEGVELAAVREKGMTNDDLKKKYDNEKDVYKKNALAREMASRGMIRDDKDFKKYAAGDRGLEFTLRTEAQTNAKNKDAWIGYREDPNKPPDITAQAARAYAGRSRTEREDWYKDIENGAAVDTKTGGLNDKFAAEKLAALQMSDFEKFSSGPQAAILSALAALEKNDPAKFSSLNLDRKFKELRDAAKISGKPQLNSEKSAIGRAKSNLHTVSAAERQRMLTDKGAIDYLRDEDVEKLDAAVQTPEVLSDLAQTGRLDALIKSGNINIANFDLTANDGALARAILSSGDEKLQEKVRNQRGPDYQAGLTASLDKPGEHNAERRELLRTGASADAIYKGRIDKAGAFQDAKVETELLSDLKGMDRDAVADVARNLKGEAKDSALSALSLEDVKQLSKDSRNGSVIREFMRAASKDLAPEDMKAAFEKLSNLPTFRRFMPPKPAGGGGGAGGAGAAGAGGGRAGGPGGAGGNRARISDAAIKSQAEVIYQRRLAGTEPGFTHAEIDQMLKDKGITPGTPEAEKFMSDWDWDMAKKELGA